MRNFRARDSWQLSINQLNLTSFSPTTSNSSLFLYLRIRSASFRQRWKVGRSLWMAYQMIMWQIFQGDVPVSSTKNLFWSEGRGTKCRPTFSTHPFFMPLLKDSFSHSSIHSFTHSFIYSFICSLMHWVIHLFSHSLIHSLIQSCMHAHIHSLTPPGIYSFMHSFIHARMHSFFSSSFLPPQTSSHWVIHVVIYVFIHSLTCLFVLQSFTHGGDHPLRTQPFVMHLFQNMFFLPNIFSTHSFSMFSFILFFFYLFAHSSTH